MMTYTRHITGCANELEVALWFARQGYEIFTSNTEKTPVDLIASLGKQPSYIQVKTAHWITVTNKQYLQCVLNRGRRDRPYAEDFDTLAVVHADTLWIIPAEELPLTSCINLVGMNPRYRRRRDWDGFRVRGPRPCVSLANTSVDNATANGYTPITGCAARAA